MNLKITYKWLFVMVAILGFNACNNDKALEKSPGEIIGISLKDTLGNEIIVRSFESSVKEQTVNVLVPGPTNLRFLTPYFELNEGATLLYNSVVAFDGRLMDFNTPAIAQVKGSDGVVREYRLFIEREGKSGYISNVTFAEGVQPESVEIDQVMKTIHIYFPKGAILSSLKPFFVLRDEAELLGNIPNGGERDMSEPIIVTIRGTNTGETDYTVSASLPKLTFDQEMFRGIGSAAACGAVVVSGDKLVLLADWNLATYRYMDLVTGEYGDEDKLTMPTEWPYGYGTAHLRGFIRDDKGAFLSMHLSMDAGLVSYKWDDPTATPVKFVDYQWADGGFATRRLAGLYIVGDLSGDAKILFTHASKKLLTFTVEGGVLNPVPVITDIRTNVPNLGNYANVIPIVGSDDFLLTLGDLNAGTEYYAAGEPLPSFTYGGFASNAKTFEYEGYKYLAIVITNKSNINKYELYDITDPTDFDRCTTPVFTREFPLVGGTQANAVASVDYAIIDDQLYVYFVGVNSPYVCYRFK